MLARLKINSNRLFNLCKILEDGNGKVTTDKMCVVASPIMLATGSGKRPPMKNGRICTLQEKPSSLPFFILLIIYSSTRCDAQKHVPTLGMQQTNLMFHHNQSGATSVASQHTNNNQRPLDRPSLSLVSVSSSGSPNLTSPPAELTDSAADWFMMGGGDLDPAETRSSGSVLSGNGPGRNNSSSGIKSTRRMAEVKHNRKHSKHSNRTIFDDDQSSDSSDSNEIYDDIEESASASGTSKEPECASHGRYYCTFKEEYPLKLVTEVTKYYKWPLEKLFRDLHAQIMPKLAQDSTGNLVCDSITRVVRPGWARNTNERWLVVINTENYHQYVTEVVCQYGTNSRCNFIPPCYYSSCQQRYNTQKLLVIDPTNPYRGPFLSEFLFPSCCVCYVPSSSESFQDKYRPSPATIYQRTMQQEATSNLNPPQFRSPQINLIEEAFSSVSNSLEPISANSRISPAGSQPINVGGGSGGNTNADGGTTVNIGSGSNQGGNSGQPKQAPLQAPAPGEIRRGGEQYRRDHYDSENLQARGQDATNNPNSYHHSDLNSFPRLGLADSIMHSSNSRKD